MGSLLKSVPLGTCISTGNALARRWSNGVLACRMLFLCHATARYKLFRAYARTPSLILRTSILLLQGPTVYAHIPI